ncbi:hypothetical protein IGI04_006811 [Brassica rapa subsp. trilocularis]|uniref:J domain-containing protein n=1 Tax=Brassica rapa subsp. trilocularis TaxID=1813537 RepID=A0ABQ7NHX8_BRACM|nr:hypothetical protein IGI04_006811 [Brassica rapa subsp. trilocularis]
MVKLRRTVSKKQRTIHYQCLWCDRSGKYKRSLFSKISNFSTWSNLTLVLLWIVMIFLIYYTKNMSHETQVLDPFSILGLEPGVSDSDIKKAYRRLSIQYHPDKNPDPGRNAFLGNKYFVESISKAYQALTDPLSRENFDKYGHPDGGQGFQMGIALPRFLLDIDGASGGILFLRIVAKLWKFFTKAAEYMEIPVRRTDDEPLQKAVPLSARKSSGVSSEGIAPFLRLPHFSDTVVKKIARKKVKSFQELQEISLADRSELLTQVATDVRTLRSEEGIQEGDIVTLQAWVTLKRPNGIVGALPHAPYLPFHKEENYWVLLADSFSNNVWFSQKVSFMDEGGAITAASKTISDTGAGVKETSDAVREATEEVKSGSALVMGKLPEMLVPIRNRGATH